VAVLSAGLAGVMGLSRLSCTRSWERSIWMLAAAPGVMWSAPCVKHATRSLAAALVVYSSWAMRCQVWRWTRIRRGQDPMRHLCRLAVIAMRRSRRWSSPGGVLSILLSLFLPVLWTDPGTVDAEFVAVAVAFGRCSSPREDPLCESVSGRVDSLSSILWCSSRAELAQK